MPTNLTKTLCETWTNLLANPEGLETFSEADGEELSSHVDACATCRAAGQAAPTNPFTILAREQTGHQIDEALADDFDRVLDDSRNDAEVSVKTVLEPSLNDAALRAWPAVASALAEARPSPEVALVHAIDAVALLVDRFSDRRPSARLRLTSSGSIRIDDDDEIEVSTLVAEMRRSAGVPTAAAMRIAAWLPEAVRSVPTLFRGIEAIIDHRHPDTEVELHVVERDNLERLAQRWAPAPSRDSLLFAIEGLEAQARELYELYKPSAPEKAERVKKALFQLAQYREYFDRDTTTVAAERRTVRSSLNKLEGSFKEMRENAVNVNAPHMSSNGLPVLGAQPAAGSVTAAAAIPGAGLPRSDGKGGRGPGSAGGGSGLR